MDKIYLLDTNPMKVKHHNDWLKDVKKQKNIYVVRKEFLMAGLLESRKNIALLKEENSFTVSSVDLGLEGELPEFEEAFPEFEEFYKIALNTYNRFVMPFRIHNMSLNSNGKTNERIFSKILENLVRLKGHIQDSAYNFDVHPSFNFMYCLVDKGIVRKYNKGKYSEVDRRLISTAFARANEGLVTTVLSSDSGLSKIAEDSFLNLKNKQINGIKDPYYLEDKINFFNTYNGCIKLQEVNF